MTETQIAPRSAVDFIQTRIAPLQGKLAAHPLYTAIRSAEQLRTFMEAHVFAVWDFMSLLKTLQLRLTCVRVPWTPSEFPASRRFLNEIVLGEESDVYQGRAVSHFELYLEAMDEFGANTAPIRELLAHPTVSGDASIHAFRTPEGAPPEARAFVEKTFELIRTGSLPALAAAFTFGREDVIPEMFRALVRELDAKDGKLEKFVWYLERHIEVDGDDHGPLARRMIDDLCGDDASAWESAADAAYNAIEARLALWDGILARLQ